MEREPRVWGYSGAGAQREVEVTKSGFQWRPETTLKEALRHCECSPASLCPPQLSAGKLSPGRPSTRTPRVSPLRQRTNLNAFGVQSMETKKNQRLQPKLGFESQASDGTWGAAGGEATQTGPRAQGVGAAGDAPSLAQELPAPGSAVLLLQTNRGPAPPGGGTTHTDRCLPLETGSPGGDRTRRAP